ncbi:TatD family hydrolase [Streptomyces paromomycinus]|uniref:TatD family hydrolase n=2 Tax=Streptomyces paromomycinus TaxID=92743 RepID=A0A401VWY3_STREY|nr:TatD family hydrolase [Streptomyces paromomycinus]
MDPDRMVRILRLHGTGRVLVNSAADWGRSDPLQTRRVGEAMLAAGFTEDDVDQVLWRNPVEFYGLSGRLDLSTPSPGTLHEGNSILRGGE